MEGIIERIYVLTISLQQVRSFQVPQSGMSVLYFGCYSQVLSNNCYNELFLQVLVDRKVNTAVDPVPAGVQNKEGSLATVTFAIWFDEDICYKKKILSGQCIDKLLSRPWKLPS